MLDTPTYYSLEKFVTFSQVGEITQYNYSVQFDSVLLQALLNSELAARKVTASFNKITALL
jgi:hypothetical protein